MTSIIIEEVFGDYGVRVSSDDPAIFRLCIDSLKSYVRAPYRRYDPTVRRWFIKQAAEESLVRWTQYARDTLHAEIEWLDGEPRAAYKAMARLYHPDHGGDEERMKKINAAFKQLAA